ncbi:hypothetical protein L2E82_47370 [Cichorium intybus]|uniref:Uncharacterized protein n=1 Tax=Cichorium intybus TaxID=13427 RepID=A0ACB8YUI9_CICIN|nr:hypothetical protein L2E82_47370 [Cichorium intybus]
MFPPCYGVCPFHLLEDKIADKSLASIKSNLWKEEPKCLKWLDSKPPLSVMYVNFGSIAVMTPQQLVEFCWGLAKSNYPFLWIIRPDLVVGDSAMLPPEFLEETDQQTNCWLSCNKWGVALEIDNDVKSEEVKMLVIIELMTKEKGNVMRKNAMRWKEKAERACVSSSGSSMDDLGKLIHLMQTLSK